MFALPEHIAPYLAGVLSDLATRIIFVDWSARIS